MALDETKPEGSDLVSTLDTYIQEDRVAINLNTLHRTSSDGSDHSFIDQSVVIGSAPTLLGTNFTVIPDTAFSSGATATSAGAGDAGKLVKLDASGVLDSSVIGASFEVTDLDVTTLTVLELIRVNAGGTALESSGKTVPTGDLVGETDGQTLTNKILTSPILTTPQIYDTSADHQYIFGVSELTSSRTITLPLLTGGDTFVFEAHTQTLTNKTLTAAILTSPVITTPQINDTSSDHQYIFAVSELAADRIVTLPLLLAGDTFVFADFIQTLTNKTLTSPVLTTPQINDTSGDHQYVFAVEELTLDRVITLPLLTTNDTFVFRDHTQTLTNKTLTAPTIGDFTNANHTHADAANGGTVAHTDLTSIGATSHADIDTHIAASAAHGVSGNLVGTTDTQTLTNKTITSLTSDGVNGHTNVGAPGGALTDGFYMWSADIVAGNAAPHFYTEEGVTIKLYQVSHADQADAGAMTTIGANTGTAGAALSLIGDTSAVDQSGALMNDLAALMEDITTLDTLTSAMRDALIAHGLIKGSA